MGERSRATLNRHCEELLRRSNPGCLRGKILHCFRFAKGFGGQVASLAMTTAAIAPHCPIKRSAKYPIVFL